MYRFDRTPTCSPIPGVAGAFHSSEIPFVFQNGDDVLRQSPSSCKSIGAIDTAVSGAMAALWAWLSSVVTRHPQVRGPMETFGRFGLPVLLVLVGLYILMDTPSDSLGS